MIMVIYWQSLLDPSLSALFKLRLAPFNALMRSKSILQFILYRFFMLLLLFFIVKFVLITV